MSRVIPTPKTYTVDAMQSHQCTVSSIIQQDKQSKKSPAEGKCIFRF